MTTWVFVCVLACLVPFAVSDEIKIADQKGIGFIQGDIIMPKSPTNRNGILRSKRWTNGVIYYEINMKGYDHSHVDAIKEAMADIEQHTCIRFKERANEPNYITIVNGNKCCSNVGMEGGQQWISLASWGCFSHRTIVHELLHSVGLWHEQMRLDRDQYITIRKENVPDKSVLFNFAMVSGESTSDYDIPYNYASVMHYDAWSFGNGDIVMEPKDESMLGVMGFAATANETDYEKVRRIYECKGTYPRVERDNEPCEDNWPDCNIHSFQCKRDTTVIGNCRKTCGYCVWGGKITATPRPTCFDMTSSCADRLKEEPNKCKDSRNVMERECALTCGFCDGAKTTPVPPTRAPPTRGPVAPPAKPDRPCKDSVDYCDQFLERCANDETVKYHCPKTCRLC